MQQKPIRMCHQSEQTTALVFERYALQNERVYWHHCITFGEYVARLKLECNWAK